MMGKILKSVTEGLKELRLSNKPVDESFNNWKSDKWYLYVFACDDKAIVVGHGQKNRASVIFDSETQITTHIKSLLVRLHCKYKSKNDLRRYLFEYRDKKTAEVHERELQILIGGTINTKAIFEDSVFREKIFNREIVPLGKREEADVNQIADIVLRMAAYSSFSAIDELEKWRRNNLLADNVWEEIEKRLGRIEVRYPKQKTSL